MATKDPVVGMVMGSDSDVPVMNECSAVLKKYDIPFEMNIMSAHRTPDTVTAYAMEARKRGIRVIIAGAGGAAHLAGVIASHTTLPVIGVPLASSELHGMDALLATVQMPSGIPVATVAIGKAGARNAALLAMQIIGLEDKRVARLLDEQKQSLQKAVIEKNAQLQKTLKSKK